MKCKIMETAMQDQDIWKYCYWLDPERFETLQKELSVQGKQMRRAEKNPCEAFLDDIGYAGPECWPVICNFDARPWFEASAFRDKMLVISSHSLGGAYEDCLETTITPFKFKPGKMPDRPAREELIRDPKFLERKPASWDDFPAEMGLMV